jgi:processive 1,2-diacylglycerol beta-glucosyltransferase
MSGGEGSVDLKGLIRVLDENPGNFQIMALAGRNLKLRSRLQRLRPRLSHHLVVLSFTDRVDELMETSDLLLTKPGGLTTAEALGKGVPMILLSPLPGQEELNSRYLESRGAALVAAGPRAAAVTVAKLLGRPELLKKMKETALGLAFPRSAREAARSILELADA